MIGDAEVAIINFKHFEYISALRYSELLRERALRCGSVSFEESRKNDFEEWLHKSVRFAMSTYWGALRSTTLQILARYAASSINPKEGRSSTSRHSGNSGNDYLR